jgi:hypothetical protein
MVHDKYTGGAGKWLGWSGKNVLEFFERGSKKQKATTFVMDF